ncbi:MAG: ankyrin repeat domain-containing protein [Chloroflexota bacterium]
MDMSQEFFKAIKAGDKTRVDSLLTTYPALVNAKADIGVSAVLLGLYYGKPEIVDVLLSRGAPLDLFEAAAVGNVDRVAELLNSQSDLLNAFAADGFTALGLAAFFEHLEVVELLLAQGAEVNIASHNDQHVMPLHSATASQQLDIAKTLLAHGAEVNAKQAGDFTPLHAAAQNGQLAMIELLLAHGAEINAKAADGKTAMTFALEARQQTATSLLRECGGTE